MAGEPDGGELDLVKVMLLLLAAGAIIGARAEATATRAGLIALAAGLSAMTLYYLGYV